MIRDLSAAAKKSGATLVTIAPGEPVAMAVATPVAPVAATARHGDRHGSHRYGRRTGTRPCGGTGGSVAVPGPAEAQVVTWSGFQLEQFINKLEGLRRSLLVSGFTLATATAETSAPGDLALALQGRVFLSPEVPAGTTQPPVASATVGQ